MRNLMFWMAATLVIFLFWSVSSRIQVNERQLAFSDFMTHLDQGQISKVTLTDTGTGMEIVGELKNGQSVRTFAPPQVENLVKVLLDKGVEVTARNANSSSWLAHIISWTPIVIMIAFLIFFMRTMQTPEPGSSPTRELKEKRLEIKARLFHAMAAGKNELLEAEVMSLLATLGIRNPEEIEIRKLLYEMLSDGTLVVTDDKKYRLNTTP